MEYIDIKACDGSNIHTSRIAMGSTMSMESLDNEEKFKLYDYFLEQGGNCIDTARAYSNGHAEEMIGEYLKSRNNRQDIVLSTKGGHPTNDNPNKSRVSKEDIMKDLDMSLKTLGTDYIDYYWIHKDDPAYPIEALVDTVNEIIKSGKARRIGASNFTTDRLIAAQKYARESNQYGFMASQIQWSLAATEDKYFENFGSIVMTPERYAYYLDNEMPVFAFSSQAQGFFSRIYDSGIDSIPPFICEQFESEGNKQRYENVKKFAEDHNCSISAASLGYLIYNKLPCVALIGAQSIDMLSQSLEATTLHMTESEADEMFYVK